MMTSVRDNFWSASAVSDWTLIKNQKFFEYFNNVLLKKNSPPGSFFESLIVNASTKKHINDMVQQFPLDSEFLCPVSGCKSDYTLPWRLLHKFLDNEMKESLIKSAPHS